MQLLFSSLKYFTYQ